MFPAQPPPLAQPHAAAAGDPFIPSHFGLPPQAKQERPGFLPAQGSGGEASWDGRQGSGALAEFAGTGGEPAAKRQRAGELRMLPGGGGAPQAAAQGDHLQDPRGAAAQAAPRPPPQLQPQPATGDSYGFPHSQPRALQQPQPAQHAAASGAWVPPPLRVLSADGGMGGIPPLSGGLQPPFAAHSGDDLPVVQPVSALGGGGGGAGGGPLLESVPLLADGRLEEALRTQIEMQRQARVPTPRRSPGRIFLLPRWAAPCVSCCQVVRGFDNGCLALFHPCRLSCAAPRPARGAAHSASQI